MPSCFEVSELKFTDKETEVTNERDNVAVQGALASFVDNLVIRHTLLSTTAYRPPLPSLSSVSSLGLPHFGD